MNRDSDIRRFRYIQAAGDPAFLTVIAGWLELVEEHEPGSPKAILEGDYFADLPDGTRLVEVSFKTEHRAVEQVMSAWAEEVGRLFGWIEGETLVLNDGRAFCLGAVRFTRRP